MSEIFKVQIAIAGNQGRTALVYNEGQTIMGEFPAPKSLLKLMKNRPKAFFEGEVVNGKINLGTEVKNPGW